MGARILLRCFHFTQFSNGIIVLLILLLFDIFKCFDLIYNNNNFILKKILNGEREGSSVVAIFSLTHFENVNDLLVNNCPWVIQTFMKSVWCAYNVVC